MNLNNITMKKAKEFFNHTKELLSCYKFKVALPYITLLIGITLYVIGLCGLRFENDDSTRLFKEICIGIGGLCTTGSIIGFIVSYSQFKRVYQKGLEEIIYSPDFLSKRTDIVEIWKMTSNVLFESKFPQISSELLAAINDKYFPVKKNSYYQDQVIDIHIKWADDEKKFIEIIHTHTFTLVAENKKDVILPLSSWMNINGLDKDQYYSRLTKFSINGEKKNINDIVTSEPIQKEIEGDSDNGKMYYVYHEIKLSDCTNYKIAFTREKRYLFDNDTDLCYKAKYIVNNLTVILSYPHEDIMAKLICRGTLNDFSFIETSPGILMRRYDGLILPRQGYVITLNRKNQ